MRRLALSLVLVGCVSHEPTPAVLPHDARAGLSPSGASAAGLCGRWGEAVGSADPWAKRHVSFPELDPKACFVPVWYNGENDVRPGEVEPGCGYDASAAATRPTLEREAARYEAIAGGDGSSLPLELACPLAPDVRARAAAQNARTLRALLASAPKTYAYSVVSTFGYGRPAHGDSPLVSWRPGDACPTGVDLPYFGVNVVRATRATLAWAGGVAPVVSFSGGAIHSKLTEAFLLAYIATCRIGLPIDRVLVDPCADHTHTNVRNTGRLVTALGARTGYIVTDDWLQGGYLQESTAFDAIGGSIDQRALRDWGYLLGAWRQASVGIRGGFWFTPYRFWGEGPLHDVTCDGAR